MILIWLGVISLIPKWEFAWIKAMPVDKAIFFVENVKVQQTVSTENMNYRILLWFVTYYKLDCLITPRTKRETKLVGKYISHV